MTKGDSIFIRSTEYVVLAVKPFPNAKSPRCSNVLIARTDGKCKTWIADYALLSLAGPL